MQNEESPCPCKVSLSNGEYSLKRERSDEIEGGRSAVELFIE